MYIVTSKPKRISVYSGLVHMDTSKPEAIVGGSAAAAYASNAQRSLMIFMRMAFAVQPPPRAIMR